MHGLVSYHSAKRASSTDSLSGLVRGCSLRLLHGAGRRFNVSLANCSVGADCTIHSGACVGQDGFGFFVDEQGATSLHRDADGRRAGESQSSLRLASARRPLAD